ncbi:methyltransferase domain-containing protein [Kribbella turkmenica]|uniref:Methyltransferase domain-containing protein n=1 Tax=Kribbella turkmenica TaxID=2530375 RepID=A0A4R4WJF2_9ACTN|nr:methyltransferase domain-containing protein [Kribbella turkmenica]TDD16533.1 methyltransferase domain-containing protein [Kribbella turkmenica]
MSVRNRVQLAVNRALRPFGVQLVRGFTTDPLISPFLPARRTIRRAADAGLSVGDYLDNYSSEPGATAETVDAMLSASGLSAAAEVRRILEIGPGSGRYTTRVKSALRPQVYEVYETAPDWVQYLRGEFPDLVFQPADGHTLAPTGSSTVDLVHAHKLLCYIPFVTAVCYLDEMARVVRPGGTVAFDLITDACMDLQMTKVWLAEPVHGAIYSVAPRDWVLQFMAQRDLHLAGSHFVPLSGGRTELLVFNRR